MDQKLLIPLIILGFPIVFGAMWCFVCLLLSWVGGWQRLASRFAAKAGVPSGKGFRFQSGQVGIIAYNHTLNVHCTPEGIHLAPILFFRFAHVPLFIPWRQIHNARAFRFFWVSGIKMDIGEPKIASIQLPKIVFQGTPLAGV